MQNQSEFRFHRKECPVLVAFVLALLSFAPQNAAMAAENDPEAGASLSFLSTTGNTLTIDRSEEAPGISLRIPTKTGTDFIYGDLAGEQGHLISTMNIDGDDTAGIRLHLTHDPKFEKVTVRAEAFGKTAAGVAVSVPLGVDGEYLAADDAALLAAYKAEAERSAASLAEAVSNHKAANPTGRFSTLLEQQSEWEQGLGERAASDAGLFEQTENTKAEDEPSYWQARAEALRARQFFLATASGTGVSPGIPGIYIDGDGGRLELLVVSTDGEEVLDFSIFVVRGPTAHTGELSGIAKLDGKTKARFKDEDEEAFIDGKPAVLDFLFEGNVVEIKGENTSYYHGARAYFDGVYFKTPETDAPASGE